MDFVGFRETHLERRAALDAGGLDGAREAGHVDDEAAQVHRTGEVVAHVELVQPTAHHRIVHQVSVIVAHLPAQGIDPDHPKSIQKWKHHAKEESNQVSQRKSID